jgi:hypothetical protein
MDPRRDIASEIADGFASDLHPYRIWVKAAVELRIYRGNTSPLWSIAGRQSTDDSPKGCLVLSCSADTDIVTNFAAVSID